MRLRIALIFVAFFAAPAAAQVIYEPANIQYGSSTETFYYGGTDAGTVRMGYLTSARQRISSPLNEQPLRVYTDLLPGMNAAVYGFDVNDARNESNANIPSHFRKVDLFKDARREEGMTIVPQRPMTDVPRGSIVIKRYHPPLRTLYGPVIVIPKPILTKPLPTAPKT